MDGALLVKQVKCNFRIMGKKFGKLMKAVSNAVNDMTQAQIATLESEGKVTLMADGQEAVVELEDVDIMSQDIPGWSVANEGTTTVALDITITPELKTEGDARRLIKQIQNLRKSQGFDITDRIVVTLSNQPRIAEIIAGYGDNISRQVLATEIRLTDLSEGTDVEFEDFKALLHVQKA